MSPRARQPRVSLEPLVQRYGNVSILARALGVDRAQVAHWRSDGVPIESADRIAIAVGRHPAEVWPEWYRLSGDEAA
ncbi:MAG: Winged helix-turn-helix DNA-binding [Acidimicrobiaceae bacterium]|nr:Winged helix-turn-helix DNA-binding [Acidimicrobiaceae bacterium]